MSARVVGPVPVIGATTGAVRASMDHSAWTAMPTTSTLRGTRRRSIVGCVDPVQNRIRSQTFDAVGRAGANADVSETAPISLIHWYLFLCEQCVRI